MSQAVIEIHGTERGIEIQDHLENTYYDIILETFGKNPKIISDADAEEIQSTSCKACGFSRTWVMWSTKYSGYRGFCMSCKHNWPES